ncbi:MAG: hypothetical protein WAP52_02900 [Candidatus Sungiibacteriota bacterium]
MTENRAPLLFALLLLLFFVSTSAGFADLSAIQNQIQVIQLKVIGEKLKAIQQGILGIDAGPPPVVVAVISPKVPEPTREALSRTLEQQIQVLQGVVARLQPQATAEEAARIEKRIAEIGNEVETASGDKLLALKNELDGLIAERDILEQQIRTALGDSIKYKQVQVIGEQIAVLREKVAVLPRQSTAPSSTMAKQNATVIELQDNIQKLQLRVLQAQVKAIQEKVKQIAR